MVDILSSFCSLNIQTMHKHFIKFWFTTAHHHANILSENGKFLFQIYSCLLSCSNHFVFIGVFPFFSGWFLSSILFSYVFWICSLVTLIYTFFCQIYFAYQKDRFFFPVMFNGWIFPIAITRKTLGLFCWDMCAAVLYHAFGAH